MTEILSRVTTQNNRNSWENLYKFPRAVLSKPPRAGKKSSLATVLNKRVVNFDNGVPIPKPPPDKKKKSAPLLCNQVAAKIGVGELSVAMSSLNKT